MSLGTSCPTDRWCTRLAEVEKERERMILNRKGYVVGVERWYNYFVFLKLVELMYGVVTISLFATTGSQIAAEPLCFGLVCLFVNATFVDEDLMAHVRSESCHMVPSVTEKYIRRVNESLDVSCTVYRDTSVYTFSCNPDPNSDSGNFYDAMGETIPIPSNSTCNSPHMLPYNVILWAGALGGQVWSLLMFLTIMFSLYCCDKKHKSDMAEITRLRLQMIFFSMFKALCSVILFIPLIVLAQQRESTQGLFRQWIVLVVIECLSFLFSTGMMILLIEKECGCMRRSKRCYYCYVDPDRETVPVTKMAIATAIQVAQN